MATKQEIIDRLSQCGGLSYQDWIKLLDSIFFDGDVSDIYEPIKTNQLPILETTHNKVSFVSSGTYSQTGRPNLVIPSGNIAVISWNGSSWEIDQTIPIPIQTGVETINPNGEDITQEKAVAKYVQPLFDNFSRSINLLDKREIGGFTYTPTAGKASALNWISTEIFDLDSLGINVGDWFTIQGVMALNSSQVRATYYPDNSGFNNGVNMNAITGQNFQEIQRTSGMRFISFRVDNKVDIGLNPESSVYYNTAMLSKGQGVKPFYEFGVVLDPEKYPTKQDIEDIEQNVSESENKIEALSEDTEFLMSFWGKEYVFNGVDAQIYLGTSYYLANAGDYVEITAKWNGTNYLDGLALLGLRESNNQQCFGFYTDTQMWLRTASGTNYVQFTGLPNVRQEFRKYKLRCSDDNLNFELYINDVLHQSVPKAVQQPFIINSIGRGYSVTNYFKGSIKDQLNIYTSGQLYTFENFDQMSGFSNVEIVRYQKTTNDDNDSENKVYPPVFVSFDPVGYLGTRKLLTIFIRRAFTNKYVGHKIAHMLDMSEVNYMDVHRIIGADEFQYSPETNSMVFIASTLLSPGESEFVYMGESGSIDHTGGYHGDEISENFQFFIDGVKQKQDVKIDLIPCNSAFYIEKSKTYKTAKGTSESPIIDHQVDADHWKRTLFTHSKYETFNDVIWQRSFRVAYWYHGICCMGKYQASEVMSEDFETAIMTGSTDNFLSKVGLHRYYFYNESNKRGAEIFAEVESPYFDDKDCTVFIWDRATDSKYYRRTPAFDTVVGDKCSSYMSVEYK